VNPNLIFKTICFFWAAVAIISRVAMVMMKEKWKEWEINSAYKAKKPLWIYFLGIFGIILIGITWFTYLYYGIQYGWILAGLISLTLVKIFTLLFNYDQFREFVQRALKDKRKMLHLNISVLVLAAGLICMGLFLY